MSRWVEACLTWPHPIESCFQLMDELFAIEVPIDTVARYIAYTVYYILAASSLALILGGLAVAIREVFCQPIIAPSRAYVRTRNFYVSVFYEGTGLQVLVERGVMRPRYPIQWRQGQSPTGSLANSSRGKQRVSVLPRERLVDAIEEQTHGTVSIERDATPEVLSRCNHQLASPLFQLPRELRDRIWQYITATYEDSNNKHAETAYYYRPGHKAFLVTDTNVLLTCRRVWLEAHSLPLQQTEHTFWFQRGPYDQFVERRWRENVTKETERAISTFRHLTTAGYRDLTLVHLHTQMFLFDWFAMLAASPVQPPPRTAIAPMSGLFKSGITSQDFRPKILQITIRHTDWWDWERDDPLRFLDERLAVVLNHEYLRGVQHFKLELETLDYKRDQLEVIVARLRQLEGCEKQTHIVDGPTNINNEPRPIYANRKELNYISLTLTWNLVFPSLPQGNVNKLRWEPRYVRPQAPAAIRGGHPDEHQTRRWDHDTTWFPSSLERVDTADSDIDEPRAKYPPPVQLRRQVWQRLGFVWPAFAQAVEQMEKQKVQGDELVQTYERQFEGMTHEMKINEVELEWARTGSLLKFEPSREAGPPT